MKPGKLTFYIIILTSYLLLPTLSKAYGFTQLEAIKYIYSSKDEGKRHFIFVAGNPVSIVEDTRNDAEIKFELCALYASTLRGKNDHATFLFYKDPADNEWQERMKNYKNRLNLGKHRFISFSRKHDIVDFILARDIPLKINGIFFFTHSFPHGLNIGIKNAPVEDGIIPSDAEKISQIETNPQYLYIPNLEKQIPARNSSQFKNNFYPDAKILLAGCRTSFETNIFRQAEESEIKKKNMKFKHASNYMVHVEYNSFSQRLSSILKAKVLSTEFSTHFETSDDGGKTFRYLRDEEKLFPGKMILMYPDQGQYVMSFSDGNKSWASQSNIFLSFIPLKPYSPLEKYGVFFANISEDKKARARSDYQDKIARHRNLMQRYNEDFENLSPDMKTEYRRELKERKALLDKLLDKEQKNRFKKSVSVPAIFWYRSDYGTKIADMRKKMGLPPLKMLFERQNREDLAYCFGGKFYSEFENFTGFLDF